MYAIADDPRTFIRRAVIIVIGLLLLLAAWSRMRVDDISIEVSSSAQLGGGQPLGDRVVSGTIYVHVSAGGTEFRQVRYSLDAPDPGARGIGPVRETEARGRIFRLDTTTIENGPHILHIGLQEENLLWEQIEVTFQVDNGDPPPPDPAPTTTTPTPAPAPKGFFASPAGSGTGTETDPASLATALAATEIRPGSTVWLRGGVYTGSFRSELMGTESDPIVVRPYPGEHVVIDGRTASDTTLEVFGAWTIIRDLEFTNSSPTRTLPPSTARPTLVDVFAPGAQFVNNYLHDGGTCLGLWTVAVGAGVYGNVIVNCGWETGESGHGHGIYTQNDTGEKVIEHNVILDTYGMGIHGFTTDGSLRHLTMRGNIIAGAGALATRDHLPAVLIGGHTPMNDITFTDNVVFSANSGGVVFGYKEVDNRGLRVEDNHIVTMSDGAALKVVYWSDVEGSGNSVVSMGTQIETANSTFIGWDRNTYYGNDVFSQPLLSFGEWQGYLEIDGGSRFSKTLPSDSVQVFPNAYDDDRAHVAVFNWSRRPTVRLDLHQVLEVGDQFEVADAQNLDGEPLVQGVYDGNAVVVPIDIRETRVPAGLGEPSPGYDGSFRALVVTGKGDE